MDTKLQEAIKTTDKVVKKDKTRRAKIVSGIKQTVWTILMFSFGFSCATIYYQYQSFVDPFLSPVK